VCPVGVESTIVAVGADGGLTLLRPGGLAASELGATLAVGVRGRTLAPGMLPSHYAPSKRLVLLDRPVAEMTEPPPAFPRCAGLLAFAPEAGPRLAALTGARIVSETLDGHDLSAAARGLFAALRRLDASPAERLYAEPCPSQDGLGHAIADRLARAAHHG